MTSPAAVAGLIGPSLMSRDLCLFTDGCTTEPRFKDCCIVVVVVVSDKVGPTSDADVPGRARFTMRKSWREEASE